MKHFLLPVMFLIFMTLKLLDKIDWSWWWVSAPLWIPAVIAIVLLIISVLLELHTNK